MEDSPRSYVQYQPPVPAGRDSQTMINQMLMVPRLLLCNIQDYLNYLLNKCMLRIYTL